VYFAEINNRLKAAGKKIVNSADYFINKLNYKSNVCRIYRVSHEEWTKLRESVPYVELYGYNPKHLYPKLNGYGDNGQRSLKL